MQIALGCIWLWASDSCSQAVSPADRRILEVTKAFFWSMNEKAKGSGISTARMIRKRKWLPKCHIDSFTHIRYNYYESEKQEVFFHENN